MSPIEAFLVVPIGLEKGAAQELSEVSAYLQRQGQLGVSKIELTKGGVSFSVEAKELVDYNSYLRHPSRILQRWDRFRVRDFPKLFQKLNKSNWKQMSKDAPVEVEVAASKSRLNNEKRILKVIDEVLEKQYSKTRGQGRRLFVRNFNDEMTLSWDTSGEHLHFRGYRKEQGAAPIRENYAFACLYQLCDGLSRVQLQRMTLIDPMMGAGTFLCEGLLWGRPNFLRQYSGQTPTQFKQETPIFKQLVGVDIDSQVVNKAKANVALVNTGGEKVKLVSGDVFEIDPEKLNIKGETLVVCNPPYGERLEIKKENYFSDLLRVVGERLMPFRIGIIIPQNKIGEIKLPVNYRNINQMPFLNAGLPVVFLVLQKL